eukprot:1153294-Pelagomonas_calceolata.AAC.2
MGLGGLYSPLGGLSCCDLRGGEEAVTARDVQGVAPFWAVAAAAAGVSGAFMDLRACMLGLLALPALLRVMLGMLAPPLCTLGLL